MRYRLVSVVAGVAALAVSGCEKSPVDTTDADFVGVVTSVSPTTTGLDVLMASNPDGTARVLHVPKSTDIRIRDAGYNRSGSSNRLVVGASIRVKTTGTELRSLPPQYFAVWIEVGN